MSELLSARSANPVKSVAPGELLDRAKRAALTIEQDAQEIEMRADITDRVRAVLADTGLFWMLMPPDLGGADADIRTAIEVMEEISRADASTGWAYFCNAVATGAAWAYGADGLVNAMFGSNEPGVVCGQFGPIGKAVKVEGGYRISGKHQFASGSFNASWIAAGQKLYDEQGGLVLDPEGNPTTLAAYFPKGKVRMAGNWDVAGLNGTGSFDYEIPEQFVPDDLVLPGAALMPGSASLVRRGPPLYKIGYFALGHAGHSSVALGMAKRALQEIASITHKKGRMGYPSAVSDFDVFRHEFGFCEASYWSARDHLLGFYGRLEDEAACGIEMTPEDHARVLQTTLHTHKVARDIVEFCHRWAGSSAVRNPSVISRVLRDMSTAVNHIINDPMLMQRAFPDIFANWTTGRLARK